MQKTENLYNVDLILTANCSSRILNSKHKVPIVCGGRNLENLTVISIIPKNEIAKKYSVKGSRFKFDISTLDIPKADKVNEKLKSYIVDCGQAIQKY